MWIHTCRGVIEQYQSRMMKYVLKWFHDHLVLNNSINSGSGKSCSSMARYNLFFFCFVAKSDNPKWLLDTTSALSSLKLFHSSVCHFVHSCHHAIVFGKYLLWLGCIVYRRVCVVLFTHRCVFSLNPQPFSTYLFSFMIMCTFFDSKMSSNGTSVHLYA